MKEAIYTMRTDGEGNYWVDTSVRWSVKDWRGKNMTHSGQRSGTIYTQSRFKAWLKKYNLKIKQDEISLLPKSI